MAGTLINKQYQYYPTVGSLFGVDAQNQVSFKQLEAIRARARAENGGALPTHGFTIDQAEVIYWGRCPECAGAPAPTS